MSDDGGATSSGSIVAYLRMNRDQWEEDIRQAKADTQQLAAEKPTINVTADTDKAKAELDEVKVVADELGAKDPTIRVKADTSEADAMLAVQDTLAQSLETRYQAALARLDEYADSFKTAASDVEPYITSQERLRQAEEAEVDAAIASWKQRNQTLSATRDAQTATENYANAERDWTSATKDSAKSADVLSTYQAKQIKNLLAMSDANKKLYDAQQELNNLQRDSAATDDALAAASRKVTDAQLEQAAAAEALNAGKNGGSGDGAGSGEGGLMGAVMSPIGLTGAIGGASLLIGPLVGAVAGLAAGFAGMGAAGVAAIAGISKAESSGSQAGAVFKAGVDSLKTDLGELEHTATGGILSGFEASIASIQQGIPSLNFELETLSNLFGEAGASVVDGLVKGLEILEPLMTEGASYITEWAAGFDSWTTSGGLQSFVGYAEQELPIVMTTIGDLSKAVVSLFVAMSNNNGGNELLGELDDIAQAIIIVSDAVTKAEGVMKIAGPIGTGFGVTFGDIAKSAGNALNPISGITSAFGKIGSTGAGAAKSAKAVGDAAQAAGAQTSAMAGASDTVAGALSKLDGQAKKASDDVTTLQQDLMGLDNGAIAASNAQLQLSSAVATFDTGLKTNGHTLDMNTAKGQANMTALNGIASAALTLVAAQAKAGDSTTTVTGTMVTARAEFIKAAEAAGDTATQAANLADQYGLIPKKVATDFQTSGAEKAEADAAQIAAAYAAIPRTVGTDIITTHTDINGNAQTATVSGKGSAGSKLIARAVGGWAFADGGSPWVSGPGSATSDSVDARLSVGEFVVKHASAAAYPSFLEAFNQNPRAAIASVASAGGGGQPVVHVYLNGDLQALGAMIDTRVQVAQAASSRRAGMGQQEIWRAQ